MIIGLISVRHTGTRATQRLFFGFKQMHPEHEPTPNCIYIRHVGEKYIEEAERDIIVIPLRRLDRIIVSWERREKDLNELRERLWQLIDRYDHKDPYYIPVDSLRRDEYLSKMNTGLGLNLNPEWQVISEKDSVNADFNDIKDKDTASRLIKEFSFFFDRFYSAADSTGVKHVSH